MNNRESCSLPSLTISWNKHPFTDSCWNYCLICHFKDFNSPHSKCVRAGEEILETGAIRGLEGHVIRV
jgi:hypothetical protein